MKSTFISFLIVFVFSLESFSQDNDSSLVKKRDDFGFMPGDIVLSPNLGWPHVTPALIRASIKAYERLSDSKQISATVTNRGVYNFKAEYSPVEHMGIGLVCSYYDMSVNIRNDYQKNNISYRDSMDIYMSATAFGIRGNYHINEEVESRFIDLYTGMSIGVTYYQKDLVFGSSNPERDVDEALPKRILNFNDGWLTYFAPTIGARIYPVRFIGLNVELGWDRGAYLFGGLAFRIGTKPIKSFND